MYNSFCDLSFEDVEQTSQINTVGAKYLTVVNEL